MGKNNNLHDFLVDVADAIREKKGTSEPINPQEFSNEIKGIESGSPFAVDFGEEIASGNAAYINALQEDIDYYNEVVRKLNAGEISKSDVLTYPIKGKLLWLPSSVPYASNVVDCWNLREYKYNGVAYYANGVSPFLRARCLELIECSSLDSRITSINFGDDMKPLLRVFKVKQHSLTSVSSMFSYHKNLKIVELDTKNVLNFNLMLRETNISKIELDMLSATSVTNMFHSATIDNAYLSNLGLSLSMGDLKTLTMDSIKFILDNCQEKAEAYTLTLNASVKTAFLAKCDEDAEYAASLAAANAKGLSIA